MRRTEESHTKRNGQTQAFRHYLEGTDWLQLTSCLSEMENCSDFCIFNEKLVKINYAFPLVRDCIEQLGRKKCHYLSTIDLREAFHTLRLALSSQKYCGITPYGYGHECESTNLATVCRSSISR